MTCDWRVALSVWARHRLLCACTLDVSSILSSLSIIVCKRERHWTAPHPPTCELERMMQKTFIASILVQILSLAPSSRCLLQSPCGIPRVHDDRSSSSTRLLAANKERPPDDEDHASDLEVSDAEALLACYSYLKRRKRIGHWDQKERRDRMRASASPNLFWEEDFSRMAAKWQQRDFMWDDSDEDGNEDEEPSELSLRPRRNNNAADVWLGTFVSFPTDPSPTRSRRSQSAKRTWMDPDFREKWYQSRWGDNARRDDVESLKEKEIEKQIRELPAGFLGCHELSDMTQDQIIEAIQTHVDTQQKRVESRKRTLENRKQLLTDQMKSIMAGIVPESKKNEGRASFFVSSEATMKEERQKRSERAKALYQKRLKNQQKTRPKKSTKDQDSTRSYLPRGNMPKDAMFRAQEKLRLGMMPDIADVETFMIPGKLRYRREVLRQILSDFYDLRGKCVPSSDSSSAGDLQFVTTCSIEDLGALVLQVMEGDIPDPSMSGNAAPRKRTPLRQQQKTKQLSADSSASAIRDAIHRIQKNLKTGTPPSVDDVEMIMKPKRLSNRRQILQKILSDNFHMMGQCVPMDDSGNLEFVTKCSVQGLGKLVVSKLRETKNTQDSKRL